MRMPEGRSSLFKGMCHTEWHKAGLKGHFHHDVKVRVYSQDTQRLWSNGVVGCPEALSRWGFRTPRDSGLMG